jgi:DNA-binding response OmpR family regulator
MSKGRILVVEDDLDIANMLRIYFTGQGYQITLAGNGDQALDFARQELPNLIVLDIILPDMDGYEVCKTLRSGARTRNIPIIFLTQKDERSDRIAGLELGADDYITKPFDIEELRLRVQNAITRAERESLTDPRTGLPTGMKIEEQLRSLLRRSDWSLLDCQIQHYDAYREVYGFLAADEVLRQAAMRMNEILSEIGEEDDFIGYAGGENFFIITSADRGEKVAERLKTEFAESVKGLYSEVDRQRGHLLFNRHGKQDLEEPFMTLVVGITNDSEFESTDLESLLEYTAGKRHLDADTAPI